MTEKDQQINQRQCLLQALATPSLHDLLPGLSFAEGEVKLSQKDWPCCYGSGQLVSASANETWRCSLTPRLSRVRELYRLYLERWAHPDRLEPPKVGSDAASAMVSALFSISQQARSRGMTLPSPNEGGGPSELWRVAMAAAFRFGLKPHVVTLGKTSVDQLYPARHQGDAPLVIFLERVDRLWDGDFLEEFEACVSYAYKARAPLFMELIHRSFVVRNDGRENSFRSGKNSLIERVQRLKSKDPVNWLPSDIREKLRSVTEVNLEIDPVRPDSVGVPHRDSPPAPLS